MNDDEEEHNNGDADDNDDIHYQDRGRSSGNEDTGSQEHNMVEVDGLRKN
jgi:hypothetical protein